MLISLRRLSAAARWSQMFRRSFAALIAMVAIAAPPTAAAEPSSASSGGIATTPANCPEGQLSDDYGTCFQVGPPGSASANLMYLRMLNERGLNPTNPDGAIVDARNIWNRP